MAQGVLSVHLFKTRLVRFFFFLPNMINFGSVVFAMPSVTLSPSPSPSCVISAATVSITKAVKKRDHPKDMAGTLHKSEPFFYDANSDRCAFLLDYLYAITSTRRDVEIMCRRIPLLIAELNKIMWRNTI